jgi:hypothetical protein
VTIESNISTQNPASVFIGENAVVASPPPESVVTAFDMREDVTAWDVPEAIVQIFAEYGLSEGDVVSADFFASTTAGIRIWEYMQANFHIESEVLESVWQLLDNR